MDESGTMNGEAGKYQGLDRSECRKQIVKDLQELGVLVKSKITCIRSDTANVRARWSSHICRRSGL
ncbi:hypothetical protein HMSSN036_86710 [Paenibacillus macerans]|nr:hypothetical protein HMSSN036_86710 [Paenibacillus macerans]